jgi:hypothetical protein
MSLTEAKYSSESLDPLRLTYTRQDIVDAIDDEDWQEFRISLKGRRTKAKLALLASYFNEGKYHFENRDGELSCWPDCELDVDAIVYFHYMVRIDNYIKALCRGGQLYAGESLKTMLETNWRPKIKRD